MHLAEIRENGIEMDSNWYRNMQDKLTSRKAEVVFEMRKLEDSSRSTDWRKGNALKLRNCYNQEEMHGRDIENDRKNSVSDWERKMMCAELRMENIDISLKSSAHQMKSLKRDTEKNWEDIVIDLEKQVCKWKNVVLEKDKEIKKWRCIVDESNQRRIDMDCELNRKIDANIERNTRLQLSLDKCNIKNRELVKQVELQNTALENIQSGWEHKMVVNEELIEEYRDQIRYLTENLRVEKESMHRIKEIFYDKCLRTMQQEKPMWSPPEQMQDAPKIEKPIKAHEPEIVVPLWSDKTIRKKKMIKRRVKRK